MLHYLGQTNFVYVYIFMGLCAQNIIHLVSHVFPSSTLVLKVYKQTHICTGKNKSSVVPK